MSYAYRDISDLVLGWPAFTAVILIVYLMVAKP
jgi:uncharacterized membrane protein